MMVTGICKDCAYRWQYGVKCQKQHLWCIKQSRIVKNIRLKSCQFYEPATKAQIDSLRKRGCGGIPTKLKEGLEYVKL